MAAPPLLQGNHPQCQALPPFAQQRPNDPTRSFACAYGGHGFWAPPCIPIPRRATKPAAGTPLLFGDVPPRCNPASSPDPWDEGKRRAKETAGLAWGRGLFAFLKFLAEPRVGKAFTSMKAVGEVVGIRVNQGVAKENHLFSLQEEGIIVNHRHHSWWKKSHRLFLEVLEDRNLLSFLPAVNYGVDLGPGFITVTDLNGDGQLDLVTANVGANSVSVLAGNGDGSFQPAVSDAVGSYPREVVVADFDRDGTPDLATVNLLSDSVSVLLNRGDGTFEPAVSYPV